MLFRSERGTVRWFSRSFPLPRRRRRRRGVCPSHNSVGKYRYRSRRLTFSSRLSCVLSLLPNVDCQIRRKQPRRFVDGRTDFAKLPPVVSRRRRATRAGVPELQSGENSVAKGLSNFVDSIRFHVSGVRHELLLMLTRFIWFQRPPGDDRGLEIGRTNRRNSSSFVTHVRPVQSDIRRSRWRRLYFLIFFFYKLIDVYFYLFIFNYYLTNLVFIYLFDYHLIC